MLEQTSEDFIATTLQQFYKKRNHKTQQEELVKKNRLTQNNAKVGILFIYSWVKLRKDVYC